jgi:hydrogenase maturation protease
MARKAMTVTSSINTYEDRDPLNAGRRAATLVLGVGNILLQDEGLGVRTVEALAEHRELLPEGVELFDGATAGADLIDVISDRRRIIVVDSVQADVEPGTILRFTGADFAKRSVTTMSLHQVGIVDALVMAGHLGSAPAEVVVIGVRPKTVAYGLELTPEIQAVLPKVVDLVHKEMRKPLP